jgi:hypothetical protein
MSIDRAIEIQERSRRRGAGTESVGDIAARAGECDPVAMRDAVAYAAILDGPGRWQESEAIYRKALSLFESAAGTEHPDAATMLQNLTGVLAVGGQHGEAERLYRRALTAQEKLLGGDHPDVALLRTIWGACSRTPEGRARRSRSSVTPWILENRLLPDHLHLAHARANLHRASRIVAEATAGDDGGI